MNEAQPATPLDRLGFHYFPDTRHFTQNDLNTWLPRLKELGARWLTLVAPTNRAVPEAFLRGLLQAGIEPVLHFYISIASAHSVETLRLLFKAYASWGVRYVILFDRPNQRSNWPASAWAQSDLVERFLDIYLPIAEAARQLGLVNVFPPLEPGGDYWDTAFLRAALRSMQRRGHTELLDSLVLGAYAWVDEHALEWGAGGPERWPAARPYSTPEGQQDQRGFYIFEWYQAMCAAVLKTSRPILLVGAGNRLSPSPQGEITEVEEANHAQRNLAIFRLLAQMTSSESQLDLEDGPSHPGMEARFPSIPSSLLACNFWLLAADGDSPQAHQAWFQAEGEPLQVVAAVRQWLQSVQPDDSPIVDEHEPPGAQPHSLPSTSHPLEHYLLLPKYEWGISDWHLDAARPFILKHRPTVGFSPQEAILAERVTIVGGDQTFPETLVAELRQAGCSVERVCGDGTEIASQLENL